VFKRLFQCLKDGHIDRGPIRCGTLNTNLLYFFLDGLEENLAEDQTYVREMFFIAVMIHGLDIFSVADTGRVLRLYAPLRCFDLVREFLLSSLISLECIVIHESSNFWIDIVCLKGSPHEASTGPSPPGTNCIN
jgi:hypothetical protein